MILMMATLEVVITLEVLTTLEVVLMIYITTVEVRKMLKLAQAVKDAQGGRLRSSYPSESN